MYTGSFQELANGEVRAADVQVRDSNGNVVDFAAASTVNVANFPSTQNVAVVNFPATQNVQGVVAVSNFPATVNVAIVSGELATINIGNLPVTQNVNVLGGTAAATTFVPSSNLASAHLLLPANAGRKHFGVMNPLNKTLVLGFANTITNTAYALSVASGAYYESPVGGYTGDVFALFVTAPTAGNVAVTEYA